uniref:Uncharacterized protein n=1 Tax=Rhizophora mucronata TaxID=61149 RepID=A0A2P2IHZ8_RHIMU
MICISILDFLFIAYPFHFRFPFHREGKRFYKDQIKTETFRSRGLYVGREINV